MAREISITVQTDDRITLEEVGQMFSRMAARAGEAVPAILGEAYRSAKGNLDLRGVTVDPYADMVEPGVAFATEQDAKDWAIEHVIPRNEAVDAGVVAAAVAEAMLTDADVSMPPLNAAIPAPGPTAWQPGQPITAGTVITSTGVPAPAPCAGHTGVELDKNGLPWDARINTSNRAKTQTGVWKMRKGLPDGEYDTVIAELRANMAAPGPVPIITVPVETITPQPHDMFVPGAPPAPVITEPVIAPPPPTGALPNLDDDNDGFPAPPPGPAVAPPAATVVPPPPVTPVPTAAMDFPNFITIVTQKQMEKKITLDEVIAVCNKYGLSAPPALMTRFEFIPTVLADLEAIWATR